MSEEKTLEDLGLEVSFGKVEPGQTYPLFGRVTCITEEKDGSYTLELNNEVKLYTSIGPGEQIDLLKERIFETGIFFAEILETEPEIVGKCKGIILGKKQELNSA